MAKTGETSASHETLKLKKRQKLITLIAAAALFVSGCALIISVFFSKSEEQRNQDSLRRAYDKLSSPPAYSLGEAEPLETLPGALEDEGQAEGSKRELLPLCVLKIPKIDLDVVVAEGTRSYVLRNAVGHFSGTALPGEAGNFCLSGHRSYVSGKFFNRLDEVEEGDALIVEYFDKTFTYIVSEILVVEPEDTWVLDKTKEAVISLITCTPIRSATHRLVVKGLLQQAS